MLEKVQLTALVLTIIINNFYTNYCSFCIVFFHRQFLCTITINKFKIIKTFVSTNALYNFSMYFVCKIVEGTIESFLYA